MDKNCRFCGDELIPGLRDFGICAWCMKESDDRQKRMKENDSPVYFQGVDEYKGEVDFG